MNTVRLTLALALGGSLAAAACASPTAPVQTTAALDDPKLGIGMIGGGLRVTPEPTDSTASAAGTAVEVVE